VRTSVHQVDRIERVQLEQLLGFGAIPKQDEAWEAVWSHLYVLYGGARGPGKSYWLRKACLGFLLQTYSELNLRNVRVGLFCETYPELQDRQISKMAVEFPTWLGEIKDTQEDGLCFTLRPEYGSGRICLRNLDKPEKYQSAEFAMVAVDELTKISEHTWDVLRGSLRWPGVPHRPFLGATNPGGVGHAWVKKLWLDRDFPSYLRGRAGEFKFIRALPSDNPFLDQAYWDELNSLPDPLRKAWVEGDWDVFEGMAFPGWNRDRHVVQPFELPQHWPKWMGIDWGFAAPFCALWLTKDPDTQRVYVYRELYAKQLTDQQQARGIADASREPELQERYADPSMWARKNMQGLVTTTADEYAQAGVPIVKGDNDRISGKRKVDRMLSSLPDGRPGLQVFSTCTNLIRTLPALPYDKVRVEDVDTDAEDHAYDGLRMGVTRFRLQSVAKQPKPQRRTIDSGLL